MSGALTPISRIVPRSVTTVSPSLQWSTVAVTVVSARADGTTASKATTAALAVAIRIRGLTR